MAHVDYFNSDKYNVEKRKYKRVDFKLDLYYPVINNKSIYKNFTGDRPILTAINLSESGICFKSRIKLKKDDFISFLMKIDNNPSFWCLCEVKWVKPEEGFCIVGCEFFLLKLNQMNTIKKYVLCKDTKINQI
ncbi:PilZ domain-containing protein [Haloimpatiens sp. FM7330]|uniref:PilZ domain-containing protein n=1 Tax=Haloimpatiens sp. FM7330 TaxID=3298610 RepID=UPI00362EF7C6